MPLAMREHMKRIEEHDRVVADISVGMKSRGFDSESR
jgi:hypothetical protein